MTATYMETEDDVLEEYADVEWPADLTARARKLSDQGDVLVIAVGLGTQTKHHKAHLDALIKNIREMDLIVDEVDRIHPPSRRELARRAREREQAEVRKRSREAAAAATKTLAKHAWLLNDVSVSAPYSRLANSVAYLVTCRIAPELRAPHVQFFHPDGTCKGRFYKDQPDTIHISSELTDYEVVATCAHECQHRADARTNPWGEVSESKAETTAQWFVRVYTKDHGEWTRGGEWKSTA